MPQKCPHFEKNISENICLQDSMTQMHSIGIKISPLIPLLLKHKNCLARMDPNLCNVPSLSIY